MRRVRAAGRPRGTLQRLHATPQWSHICTALTTLAGYLDSQPRAIDYERRRHLDYASLLLDAEWEDIRLRTDRADHVQLSRRLAPYARHVLFTRLSGGLPLTWAPFSRPGNDDSFKNGLAAFITCLTPELAAELTRVEEEFLIRHQFRDEPHHGEGLSFTEIGQRTGYSRTAIKDLARTYSIPMDT